MWKYTGKNVYRRSGIVIFWYKSIYYRGQSSEVITSGVVDVVVVKSALWSYGSDYMRQQSLSASVV